MKEMIEFEESENAILLEDKMICVEVVFINGTAPYDVYRFGNLNELKEKLSDEFMAKEVEKQKADSGFVQNIYFRARTSDNKWKTEYRIGSKKTVDLEAFILKEE